LKTTKVKFNTTLNLINYEIAMLESGDLNDKELHNLLSTLHKNYSESI